MDEMNQFLTTIYFFLKEQIIVPIIPTIIPGKQIKNKMPSAIVSFTYLPIFILSRMVITSNSSKRIPMDAPVRIK
jgi:hypothetical protein